MAEKVIVKIRSIQTAAGGEKSEPIEVIVPGKYFFREGCHYVRYEEIMDEEAPDKITVNLVKLDADHMEVRKSGEVSVHMLYEANKKNISFYCTPFGDIRMGIATTAYSLCEEDDRLMARVSYAMDFNDEHATDCDLVLEVLRRRDTK